MLQTLSFSGPRQIDAKASFFRYESGSAAGADHSVRVRASGNDLGVFLPGDAIELPQAATRWEIIPLVANCKGTVRLGMGRVTSSRLSGQVETVDSMRSRVMQDGQFVHSVGMATPGADFFAQGQVFNADQRRGVAIQSIVVVQSDLAQEVWVMSNTVLLAGSTFTTRSKKIVATGVAEFAQVSTVRNLLAVDAGPSLPGLLAGFSFAANVPAGAVQTNLPLSGGPIVLGPGTGLVVSAGVPACGFRYIVQGEVFDW